METTRRDDGFTLIELLVVVIIIAILAGVAIPVYLGQRRKGSDAAAKSDLRNLVGAQADYFDDEAAYAASVAVLEGAGLNRTPGVVLATCGTSGGFYAAGYHPSGSRSFEFDSTSGVVRAVAAPSLPTDCVWDATGPVLAEPPASGVPGGGSPGEASTETPTSGTSEPASGGTSEPSTGGTSEPTTGGTSEPTTGGTSEPTTGGTSEPTTGTTPTPTPTPTKTNSGGKNGGGGGPKK